MINTPATLVWHALLELTPEPLRAELCHSLTIELEETLALNSDFRLDLSQEAHPLEEELDRIHFSWIAPFLRALSQHEVRLFLSCLSPPQATSLREQLRLSNDLPHLTFLGTVFLKKTLLAKLSKDPLPDPSTLQQDPLHRLLDLSITEWSSLIELLSMHDLSTEIRQIIETAKLKKVYSILGKNQTTFLKTLLHKKESVTFKKMGLVNWNGDRSSLQTILTQRGINRIAKSLYGRPPALLWYAAHHLDTERGTLLIDLCSELNHPKAASLLAEQVLELIPLVKQNNPPPFL